MIELLIVEEKIVTGPIPGTPTLLAGNDQLGWYGEVPVTDFINGPDLATRVGLTLGTSQNPTGAWLKFAYQGKILFIAKQTYRHSISMDAFLNAQIATGNRTVTIGGRTYRIRLMTGTDGAGELVTGGEWNALMYRVAAGTQIPAEDKWANYTTSEMSYGSGGNGYITWCREVRASAGAIYATRGNGSITAIHGYTKATASFQYGWRPVLELVP
jgi:hypothetical protein